MAITYNRAEREAREWGREGSEREILHKDFTPDIDVFHRMREKEGGKRIHIGGLMKRNYAVVEYTQCHVKTKSKLTNLKINSRIEGYNGK